VIESDNGAIVQSYKWFTDHIDGHEDSAITFWSIPEASLKTIAHSASSLPVI
jgi:hypothetical protein